MGVGRRSESLGSFAREAYQSLAAMLHLPVIEVARDPNYMRTALLRLWTTILGSCRPETRTVKFRTDTKERSVSGKYARVSARGFPWHADLRATKKSTP